MLRPGKGAGNPFQNLVYTYDDVGNILNLANDVAVSPPSQFGGPTSQRFVYDDLYRLTGASGSYQFSPNKSHQYTLAMRYDSIHNIASKQQAHVIVQPSGVPITQKKTSYVFAYAYNASGPTSTRPHAPTHIGDRTYSYDANGNQTGFTHDQNGTRRNIVWDEENRIQSIFDNGHEKTYKYDDQGERVIKRGPQGETVYVNQYFTIRNLEGGTKHVFAGPTRMVSKLMKQDKPGANPKGRPPREKDLFFYHPDHLGSTGYVTDTTGKLFQHLEYFPFGETWVEEASNTQRTPYRFTGKELDEETGLYYFGARYYDPRTSVWQSADPILGKYLPTGNREGDRGTLPMGGVFNSLNLNSYGYSHQNPVKLTDPDGNATAVAGCAAGAGVGVWFGGVGAVPGCGAGAAIATAVTIVVAGAVGIWAIVNSNSQSDDFEGEPTPPVPVTSTPASPPPPDDPDEFQPTGRTAPVRQNEVTTYRSFVDRSVVRDNLEAHELWQHANLSQRGLATTRLSTAASQQNPVIALSRTMHLRVNAAQRALNARAMTPLQNIRANAQILRNLNAAPARVINQAERQAISHAQSLGF